MEAFCGESQNERQFPVRRYQNRNLKDLDFPHIAEPSETNAAEARISSLLPYFTKTTRYCTTAVLEESVIDNESLKQTAFLKAFDPRFLDELFKVEGCTRAIVHLPDMEISHQGDRADSLVVIVHGQVDVYVDGVWQRRLSDGDYFGERELLGASTERSFTAICATFCDARVIYRNCLTKTLSRCPAVKDDFQKLLSVWNRKSERDALRYVKVFTQKFMECLDAPCDGRHVHHSSEAADMGRTVSPRLGNQSARMPVHSPASPRSPAGGGSPMRKIGHAALKAGMAIAA